MPINPTLAQAWQTSAHNASSTTPTVACTTTPVNNAIVIFVIIIGSTSVSVSSISGPHATFVKLYRVTDATTTVGHEIWWGTCTATGATTATVNLSGAGAETYLAAMAFQGQGLQATFPVTWTGGAESNSAVQTTSLTSGSVATITMDDKTFSEVVLQIMGIFNGNPSSTGGPSGIKITNGSLFALFVYQQQRATSSGGWSAGTNSANIFTSCGYLTAWMGIPCVGRGLL